MELGPQTVRGMRVLLAHPRTLEELRRMLRTEGYGDHSEAELAAALARGLGVQRVGDRYFIGARPDEPVQAAGSAARRSASRQEVRARFAQVPKPGPGRALREIVADTSVVLHARRLLEPSALDGLFCGVCRQKYRNGVCACHE